MLPPKEVAESNPNEDNAIEKKETSKEQTKSLVAELEGLDDDDDDDDLDYEAGNEAAGAHTSLDYDDDDDAELDDLENFLTKAKAST